MSFSMRKRLSGVKAKVREREREREREIPWVTGSEESDKAKCCSQRSFPGQTLRESLNGECQGRDKQAHECATMGETKIETMEETRKHTKVS